MHVDTDFYSQIFWSKRQLLYALAVAAVEFTAALYGAVMWVCFDHTNAYHFPTLHPTFPTVSRLGMGKNRGAHTAETADPDWMKEYTTPYI